MSPSIPRAGMMAARAALINESARFERPQPSSGMRGTVSVVIPCYNYGHFLERCVGSVVEQPDVDVEIIIVDDASPDGSGRTAEALARAHDNVQAIVHGTNQKHIATYNDGLARASGDYVVLLSADDVLAERSLSRAVSLMQVHPEVGLVYGCAPFFQEEPPEADGRTEEAWVVYRGDAWIRGRSRTGHNPIRCPEVVMRTSVFRQVGDYRAELPYGADFAMWLGAAAVSDVGYVVGVPQAFYRVHDANMSRSQFGLGSPAGIVPDLLEKRKCFETIEPGREQIVRVAYRTLARQALRLASRSFVWGVADVWPITDLKAFAIETYPAAATLPEWRMLGRRQALGSRARRNPMFLPSEAWHRMSEQAYTVRSSLGGL